MTKHSFSSHPKLGLNSTFTRLWSQLYYVILIPIFFLAFAILYRPERIVSLLSIYDTAYGFNVTITALILLGVMVLSRTIYMLIVHITSVKFSFWIIWQVIELIVSSLFVA